MRGRPSGGVYSPDGRVGPCRAGASVPVVSRERGSRHSLQNPADIFGVGLTSASLLGSDHEHTTQRGEPGSRIACSGPRCEGRPRRGQASQTQVARAHLGRRAGTGTRQVEHRQGRAWPTRRGCADGFSSRRTHRSNPEGLAEARARHAHMLEAGEPALQGPGHVRGAQGRAVPTEQQAPYGTRCPFNWNLQRGRLGQRRCLGAASWDPGSRHLQPVRTLKGPYNCAAEWQPQVSLAQQLPVTSAESPQPPGGGVRWGGRAALRPTTQPSASQ